MYEVRVFEEEKRVTRILSGVEKLEIEGGRE
jgi:hypothetical protein